MNPAISLIRRMLFGKDWQTLRTTNTNQHAHIARLVDAGVQNLTNRVRLSFDPTQNTYWLAYDDDKRTSYTPLPYAKAREILDNPDKFKDVKAGWAEDAWCDERMVQNKILINSLTHTGIGDSEFCIQLKQHKETKAYWLEHLTTRGLGAWHEYNLVHLNYAKALQEDPSLFKCGSPRHWPIHGWLDETNDNHHCAIESLITTDIQNEENGISLMHQPNTNTHWLKHLMIRKNASWHLYQPISSEQANQIEQDTQTFSEYVLHNWIEKDQLNQYIAKHEQKLAMLIETGIEHPSKPMSLLKHKDTNEYWMKQLRQKGCRCWFTYQRVSDEFARAVGQDSAAFLRVSDG